MRCWGRALLLANRADGFPPFFECRGMFFERGALLEDSDLPLFRFMVALSMLPQAVHTLQRRFDAYAMSVMETYRQPRFPTPVHFGPVILFVPARVFASGYHDTMPNEYSTLAQRPDQPS